MKATAMKITNDVVESYLSCKFKDKFGGDEAVSLKGHLMKAVCLLILATGALMAANGPSKGDPYKGDLDKLRGTWLTGSLVNNGKTLVDEE